MKTKILHDKDPECIAYAQKVVREGGIVAFPTDTVYGIGVSAFDNRAIQKLYAVKKRAERKAIPILIAETSHLHNLISTPPPQAKRLMEHYWPGPLTLVLPAKTTLPPALSPEPTVGIRIPDSRFTRELLRATGPLAATSANLSGKPSAQTPEDVITQFTDHIELIIDGGETPGERASTVVDCTSTSLRILRHGPISADEIRTVWGSS
ncbi:MAG: L-threonylcarbamoyladenylate synthase [Anaerolineales bacterium]